MVKRGEVAQSKSEPVLGEPASEVAQSKSGPVLGKPARDGLERVKKSVVQLKRHACKEDLSDMEAYVSKVASKLGSLGRKDLVGHIKKVSEAFKTVGGFFKASGCTGTNVSLPTALAFFRAMKVAVPVHEVFGAEEVPFKQKWIKLVCELCGVGDHCLFEKAEDLRKDEARCVVHAGPCAVPSISSPMSNRPSFMRKAFHANSSAVSSTGAMISVNGAGRSFCRRCLKSAWAPPA